FIYEIPYAFSMEVLTVGNVEALEMEGDSVFAFQNSLFASLWWEGGDIFTAQADVQISLCNMYAQDAAGNYLKADEGTEGYIEYSLTLMNDSPLYMYLNTENMQTARIYVDGADAGAYFDVKQYDILCVSDYTAAKTGDTVTIRVVPGGAAVNITEALFCYEDTAVLQAYHDYQETGAVDLERLSDAHLKGSFDNREGRGTILFSIPFSEGWRVYIDGKRQNTAQGAGIFLSVSDVPEGEHTIELKYVPKGFYAGLFLSLLCLVVVLAWLVCRIKKERDMVLKKRLFIGTPVVVGTAVFYLAVCFCVDGIRENGRRDSRKAQENAGQETILFGSMEQDGNPADGAEPVEWLVLDVQDGKALVVSRYALACLPYSGGEAAVTWEDSYLREWLNGAFYETVFTEEEKNTILATQLDNGRNSTAYMDAGGDTLDKVFVLDCSDIQNYFGVNAYVEENKFYSENAICEATASAAAGMDSYSLSQDKYDDFYVNYGYSQQTVGSRGCGYWLRGPGLYTTGNALLVGGNGSVFDIGCFVTEANFVRPAMWITYEGELSQP
ncbi:MAG: YfhO family protein, partial [Lachnospiraceae bacterium]|nr:YfhO family protein [Lachnospiraceae bacterium]